MTDLDEITADQLEDIFHAALGQGDVKGRRGPGRLH